MAKTAANLAAKFVCDEAIQLLGGYGFSREYPVERVYRDIPRALHRRGHGRDPTQLHRHERVARRNAGQRRLEVAPEPEGPSAPCSHPRFDRRSPAPYRQPGGAWDRPSLDELLTARASDELADRVARVAGGLRATRRRGRRRGRVAVGEPRRSRAAVPRVLAARRDRRAAPSLSSARRKSSGRGARSRRSSSSRISTRSPPARRSRRRWTDREQLAAVLFTSGSSGTPKGVLHTQATLAYKAALMADVHALTRRRLRADARTVRAHLRTAQRDHAARRRAVPHGVHGALGSGGRARPHRTRARDVHGRSADVLRVARCRRPASRRRGSRASA